MSVPHAALPGTTGISEVGLACLKDALYHVGVASLPTSPQPHQHAHRSPAAPWQSPRQCEKPMSRLAMCIALCLCTPCIGQTDAYHFAITVVDTALCTRKPFDSQHPASSETPPARFFQELGASRSPRSVELNSPSSRIGPPPAANGSSLSQWWPPVQWPCLSKYHCECASPDMLDNCSPVLLACALTFLWSATLSFCSVLPSILRDPLLKTSGYTASQAVCCSHSYRSGNTSSLSWWLLRAIFACLRYTCCLTAYSHWAAFL